MRKFGRYGLAPRAADRASAIAIAALCVLQFGGVRPTLAQAPSVFDSQYSGSATQDASGRVRGTAKCPTIREMRMTVGAGHVTIHEIQMSGRGPTFTGTVDATGNVSASAVSRLTGGIITVSGTIQGNTLTGQRLSGACAYSLNLTKS